MVNGETIYMENIVFRLVVASSTLEKLVYLALRSLSL